MLPLDIFIFSPLLALSLVNKNRAYIIYLISFLMDISNQIKYGLRKALKCFHETVGTEIKF